MLKRLFITIFCFIFYCGNLMGTEMLIFMMPITEGKTETLRENIFQEEDRDFLADLGISKYNRWIQTINENDFLIHQFKGENLEQSFKNLNKKIIEKDPSALTLKNLYKDALNLDIQNNHWIPQKSEITQLINMNIERGSEDSSKEYCFVYPVLPSKKEKLLEFYKDKNFYNSSEIQNIFKFRNIDKYQLWLQEANGNTFLVVYQNIIGPVADARNKFLDSKEEALSKHITDLYSEFSGLPYEKLLPTLESLDDAEILK